MTGENGYIQFRCDWEPADPPAGAVVAALIAWRDRLYQLGLIGVYPDGIGFGNISARGSTGATFVISGTATGGLPRLGPEHFAEVTAFDFAANSLHCRGPVRASSESLSHAAVYASDPTAGVVIHVHHLGMWDQLRDRIPTTCPRAEAGTPEMAWAIEKLLGQPAVRERGVFVMGGHHEGLMAFGRTPDEAGERVVEAYRTVR
ncbi:MAG: class aldolase/adducin family protein [Gemmataceae bacterium]|nr:class aldolase/adducin family protein [Gemmataceae bacterium]